MTDINNRTLYHQAATTDYACTVKKVPSGLRVYDRNAQKIVTTTDELCFLVTGPAGEHDVLSEELLYANYDAPEDEKMKKKLMKGKLLKIKARTGAAKLFYLRVPADERFTVYTNDGSVIQGNTSDHSVDHADGDCVICPIAMDGGPDLDKKSVMNGQVFKERYGV